VPSLVHSCPSRRSSDLEYSHKYTRDSIVALAREAGFARATIWTDPDEFFGVGLFQLALDN
jgi:uncharacterized SAM-dependent methyltransferase